MLDLFLALVVALIVAALLSWGVAALIGIAFWKGFLLLVIIAMVSGSANN